MTWLLGLMAGFIYLGTRRRGGRIGVYMKAFLLIMVAATYETLKLHLL